ncbi:hypothetical protein [Thauera sinica]|uniref:Phage protein n=1 Tax=Thauera sinica TaxID=2665146 RepID=A0ABW1ARM2_9RHOO|nr:hypothetical protein [Thauera sp. K11]ATE60154.1 hypothetical protein CCZ27_09525 [Thauera sp. K11]
MVDVAKVRRESMRWIIMLVLNQSRPVHAFERIVLSVVQAEYPDATQMELRREIDYLVDRELAEVQKHPDGRWQVGLTRCGVDVVEYTVDCDPGIARPQKYWSL